MIFEHIETLKKKYTDKYVVVDESRPELQRFRGLTGSVKTVNMSGRALVEFDGYNNIGWYDIDPAFLRVVDAPLPKPTESKRDKAAAPKADDAAGSADVAGLPASGAPPPDRTIANTMPATPTVITVSAPTMRRVFRRGAMVRPSGMPKI